MSKDKLFNYIVLGRFGIVAIIFSITTPSVKQYFYANADQNILAIAEMISLGLDSIILYGSTKEGMLRSVRGFMTLICVAEAVLFCINNYIGYDNVNARFILMAVYNSAVMTVIMTMIKDIVNSKYSGSELTIFNNKITLVKTLASFISLSLFIALISNIDIKIALIAQCGIVIFASIIDVIIIKCFSEKEEE